MALAIGATTAVFSIVNGVLLKPLPFRDPDALVRIGSMSKDGKLVHLSVPDFIDYRDQTRSFVGMAQIQERNSANLSIAGSEPHRLNAASVGAKFFDLLGAPMQLGRGFVAGEDSKGAQRVVVLSDRLWRASFSADKSIIGRAISINGDDFTVIGVAPPLDDVSVQAGSLAAIRVRAVDDAIRKIAARTSCRRSPAFGRA